MNRKSTARILRELPPEELDFINSEIERYLKGEIMLKTIAEQNNVTSSTLQKLVNENVQRRIMKY